MGKSPRYCIEKYSTILEFVKCTYGMKSYVIVPLVCGITTYAILGTVDTAVGVIVGITVSLIMLTVLLITRKV